MIAALVAASLAVAPAEPRPLPSPSPRPIADSIERVIGRLEAERKDPCLGARNEGVPCFPAETETKGPTASVRESLGILGPPDKPSPDRPPTRTELEPYRPMPEKPLVSVSFDPGCVGKSILKGLRGKNDTYYLYRLRDTAGLRAALYDHRIDATTFQGEVAFLGEFRGECAALAAYEQERRRLAAPTAGPTPAPAPRE